MKLIAPKQPTMCFTHWIVIVIIIHLFPFTASAQHDGNAVVFYLSPGISSTLKSGASTYDNDYFYAAAPYFSFSTALQYQQQLNKQVNLATGFGMHTVTYAFHHENFYQSDEHAQEIKQVQAIAFNIPLGINFTLPTNTKYSSVVAHLGAEIAIIHAYGESTHFEGTLIGGGGSTDSTIYAEYPSFAPNAQLRLGLELNNLFDNPFLNVHSILKYQLLPYGLIHISNTVTESGIEKSYQGTLSPNMIAFYVGLHVPFFVD